MPTKAREIEAKKEVTGTIPKPQTLFSRLKGNGDNFLITGINPRASSGPNSAPRGGVLYPPLMAGLFDLQISIHFVFEI